MIGNRELKVKLPKFVIPSTLYRTLTYYLPDDLGGKSDYIIFDWSDVSFFDDYTLLKLIFIQRQLRLLRKRVKNIGFLLPSIYNNRQSVLRQLWAVGLPEITASSQLHSEEQLKNALEDESELLESDPLHGEHSQTALTAVIPMLCCHDQKNFETGSREENLLDSFIRACLRPSDQGIYSWDLVESREFRHLLLQQLRRNVTEHSLSEKRVAVGLAIVRVWSAQSLADEWGLLKEEEDKLLSLWEEEPIPAIYPNLGDDYGILQISILDDGVGIPNKIYEVHESWVYKERQQEFFRLRYRDSELDKRFEEPASWKDEKARLIAFATDLLGTSKPDRPAEVKGLEYLRTSAVIHRGGFARIESDGAAINNFTHDRPYGQPCQLRPAWCKSGGTGICLAVPMSRVESNSNMRKWVPHAVDVNTLANTSSLAERIKVKDYLFPPSSSDSPHEINRKEIVTCGKNILNIIQQSDRNVDRAQIRFKKLLIIDFSELPDSKDIIHYLFIEIAQGLAEVDTRLMQPFVFVNLPEGLCGLVGRAIKMYSNPTQFIPVLAFTAEQEEPFWLGLDDENRLSTKLRHKISCEIRRKITDQAENFTEAFYRDCLNKLLSSKRPEPINSRSVLSCISFDSYSDIQQSPAFIRLNGLVKRCALFREEMGRSFSDDEIVPTGRFQPVFHFEEIVATVRELFLDKFREVFTTPPVCFKPRNKGDGIRLPHSSRISARYFRSDALVDSPIAAELARKLTYIALGIATQLPSGRVDWVVSCTSPLHWFVHKIVDGLAEYGINCSHHVFPSYEDILYSIEDIPMRPGEIVIGFTDVIASGQTVFRMAESLINNKEINMVGLIALADIRTHEEHKMGPDILKIFDGKIFSLYNKAEPHCPNLLPAYYTHPETVVPKRVTKTDPMDEFFHQNYAGIGPIVEKHAYFESANRSLQLMTSLDAVRFGHFQHGSHHSEIFVDVEKILLCSGYRNQVVTAIFRYIIENDIRLVIYPSHSSAYLLAGDLKQRLEPTTVEIIMACRTFKGVNGTSYALTRFSPYPEPHWKRFSNNAILVLDDAVCTGETVKSIISELVRIDQNYYEKRGLRHSGFTESLFSVHVVAFLNRLPRVTGDFWGGLPRITSGRIQFSAFISMPLASDSEDLCPQCRLVKRLEYMSNSADYCQYSKEFIAWWKSNIALLSSHERRHFDNQRGGRFLPEEVIRLAGYFSAIERQAYHSVRKNLFDTQIEPAKEKSIPVRVHIRSRAAFLLNLLPETKQAEDMVCVLCEELDSLIELAEKHSQDSHDDTFEILKALALRYLRTRPTQDEVEQIMDRLLDKFAHAFDDRLLVGAIACILDSCLKWLTHSEQKAVCDALHCSINKVYQDIQNQEAKLRLDWFRMYPASGGKKIDSVGEAVTMLAEFGKKGRSNHFYGRHDLDELREVFTRQISQSRADQAEENIRRAHTYSGHFLKLVKATRILQSSCIVDVESLRNLQIETERSVTKLRMLCDILLGDENTEGAGENYSEVKYLYLKTYDRWFPEGEPKPWALKVISNFTPNLYDTLVSAWESFSPARPKNQILLDMTGLQHYRDLKVVVDPSVLDTAMRQLFDNIDKHAYPRSTVSVSCAVRLPEVDAPVTDIDPVITSGKVGIIISNNNTPRLAPSQIKTSGLADVKIQLQEYGGKLYHTCPKNGFSFQVTITLPLFDEGEK